MENRKEVITLENIETLIREKYNVQGDINFIVSQGSTKLEGASFLKPLSLTRGDLSHIFVGDKLLTSSGSYNGLICGNSIVEIIDVDYSSFTDLCFYVKDEKGESDWVFINLVSVYEE